MRARFTATTALTVATALTLGACSADNSSDAEGAGGISLLATTTPLGSVTSQLATCAGGSATTLMPVNADPHDFSASSAQVAEMVRADLVIANGLGLEAGLDAALSQVEADGTEVLHVAELVNPLPFGDHAHEHEGADHDHAHGDLDPHFWLDAARMADAARLIGDRVTQRSGEQSWADCGAELATELAELDGELRETLAVIPEQRRAIVTDHEAFGYFNEAYDFRSVGVVVPGGSTEAQPSSRDLAALAGAIQEEGVPVIFSNVALNPGLVEALAAEVGESVQVVALYEGSVGPEGSPAADYQGMMRENARLVAEALS